MLALLTLALSTAALAAGAVAIHAVVARAEETPAPAKHLVEVWVAAVPVRLTRPRLSVSTWIFTRLESFSSASSSLILTVIIESLA